MNMHVICNFILTYREWEKWNFPYYFCIFLLQISKNLVRLWRVIGSLLGPKSSHSIHWGLVFIMVGLSCVPYNSQGYSEAKMRSYIWNHVELLEIRTYTWHSVNFMCVYVILVSFFRHYSKLWLWPLLVSHNCASMLQ